MNRPSKCKNCQWYGKPYWSITNPCDNCPNENDYKTIIQLDGVPIIKETLNNEEIKEAMESKSIIELILEDKDKEIEKLKNGYCELKEKCDKGECDCTKEEYDDMCEANMKLSLEVDRLNNIINELEKYLEQQWSNWKDRYDFGIYAMAKEDKTILDKLKELKEGK